MAMGNAAWSALRAALPTHSAPAPRTNAALRACLVPQASAEYAVPARIGDYTDFYTSIYHATNIGKQFRPDNPLLLNYQWVPIGYHGRASSWLSRAPRCAGRWVRACRQARLSLVRPMQATPTTSWTMGIYVGSRQRAWKPRGTWQTPNRMCSGLCLLNDWSARDIQGWEYQPLGPFLSKNFGSTLSSWIVTMKCWRRIARQWTRPADDPQPLPYLDAPDLRSNGAIDIQLARDAEQRPRCALTTLAPHTLCRTSYRHAS